MIQIRRDNRHQKSESSSSSPRDIKPNKSPNLSTESAANGHSPSRRNQRSSHRSPYAEGGIDSTTGNASSHNNEKNLQRLEIGYSNEHRYRQKSPHKHNSRKSSAPHLECESKIMYEKSSPKNSRQGDLDSYIGMRDAAIPKENCKRKKSKPRPLPLKYPEDSLPPDENEEVYIPRSPGMSPSTQRKWVWTKVKDVLKGNKREEDSHFSLSAPSSPASAAEALTFDFDLEKAKEEETFNSPYHSHRTSDSGGNPMLLPNSNPSATVTELLRELQQNLSDDFNKKLEEWQRCRAEGIQKIAAPEVERKDSFGRSRKISKPEKKMSTGEKLSKGSYHMPKKVLGKLLYVARGSIHCPHRTEERPRHFRFSPHLESCENIGGRKYKQTLFTVCGTRISGMILPKEDRVPGSHMALLRGNTAAFGVWLWGIVLRQNECRYWLAKQTYQDSYKMNHVHDGQCLL
ncbi:uncharacterized protein TNCV_1823441 [Trichonephila clavipes]|nr:uncharacterized protein TNCV_1823441 [Trichonephila clavipes]